MFKLTGCFLTITDSDLYDLEGELNELSKRSWDLKSFWKLYEFMAIELRLVNNILLGLNMSRMACDVENSLDACLNENIQSESCEPD